MAHYALPAVMREYAMKYPGNRIRIIDCSASEVGPAVLSDLAEFGITIQLERRAELAEQAILREPFMFFCREDHPFSSKTAVSWKEVSQADLIVVSRLSGNRACNVGQHSCRFSIGVTDKSGALLHVLCT